MKLFKISQDWVTGYDTYDSAVVAAESEHEARRIHPSPYVTHVSNDKWMGTYFHIEAEYENEESSWVRYADIEKVSVEYLGETEKEKGVILASFNAG